MRDDASERAWKILPSRSPRSPRQTDCVEIYIGDACWAEMIRDEHGLRLDVRPHPDGGAWHLSLAQLESALTGARRLLQPPGES